MLLPEEVILLVNKQFAKLVQYRKLQEAPTPIDHENYDTVKTNLLEAEAILYKKKRKEDLEKIVDKILIGKQKKDNTVSLTREQVLEEELNKSCEVSEVTMIWPIFTEQPDKGE